MRHSVGSCCAIAQILRKNLLPRGQRSFGFTRRCWLTAAVLATSAAMPTLVAQASQITFAQFSEASPGGNLFKYVDNGTGNDAQFGTSTGGAVGAAIPVNFTYLTVVGSLPADLIGNQAATLSMTSSTTTAASVLGGVVGLQNFGGGGTLSNSISIIRNTPAAEGTGARTNLLTVTFTAQLLGAINGRTPQFSGDTGLGFTVNYTSDFLTFDNQLVKDFSLTFSSWTNVGNGNGLALAASNFFQSATASGTGTFDASATVPEPTALVLGLLGAAAILVVNWRLRQRQPAKCPVRRQ
jgi:hypothetical protein